MNKALILVVEDDRPIRNLIVTTLKTHDYKYITAENGSSAILEASSHKPEIILLDLGLPDMEGVDVIKKVRTWSNVPIIVISARSEDVDKIEALDAGADDYITKPFNVKLLLARCNNLLRNRRLLLKKLTRTEAMIPQEAGGFTAADQKLLDTASEVIKRNFDNPDFDMNMLASELNMGRSKMFLRLKEVMGLTPNEFTMKLKLEEALRLLQEEPQYNISEISYRLGFTSPRYFSRCFKSFYGVAPLSYRKDSPREDSQAEEDIQE